MKWFGTFFVSILILSCNSSKHPKHVVSQNYRLPDWLNNKFLDYDELEAYSIDYKYSDDTYENKSKSILDSIKYEVIMGNIPNSISDTEFINMLPNIGFVKSKIYKSKFNAIDSFFIETHKDNIADAACAFTFRDILIFKKQNNVIGMARICFDCSGHILVTSKGSYYEFGEESPYIRLKELLRNK